MSVIFSVIICTYNRVGLLSGALESIGHQKFDNKKFEIIVVDNNSTDYSKSLVESFIKKYPNTRYIIEPHQGLSFARNRGWMEARGEYVAYIDDDARAEKNWLEVALMCFKEIQPEPKVVGGPILPYYTIEKP